MSTIKFEEVLLKDLAIGDKFQFSCLKNSLVWTLEGYDEDICKYQVCPVIDNDYGLLLKGDKKVYVCKD